MDDTTRQRIAELVRRGWGWEDIACELKLNARDTELVKSIVLKGRT